MFSTFTADSTVAGSTPDSGTSDSWGGSNQRIPKIRRARLHKKKTKQLRLCSHGSHQMQIGRKIGWRSPKSRSAGDFQHQWIFAIYYSVTFPGTPKILSENPCSERPCLFSVWFTDTGPGPLKGYQPGPVKIKSFAGTNQGSE